MSTRIELPPDLEAFTHACVTSGRYSDTSDVVCAALKHLQKAESQTAGFVRMLDETEAEAARDGTHAIDHVLAEVDAIIDTTKH